MHSVQYMRPKLKYMKDVYYSDFSRYEHDPPGHTCGLPCCREDPNLHLQHRATIYSCIPAYQKVLEANFTFRKKQVGFIRGRPTFTNTFYSLQHRISVHRHRMPIPVFQNEEVARGGNQNVRGGGGGMWMSDYPYVLTSRPVIRQGEHIYRRAICLPELSMGQRRFRFPDHDSGESLDYEEDNDDATIEYYTAENRNLITAPNKVVEKSDDVETVGRENRGFAKEEEEEERQSIVSLEHYYDVLVPAPRKPHITSALQQLYPDLNAIQEESEIERFAHFGKMYINTLARKKEANKLDFVSQMAENFASFPQGLCGLNNVIESSPTSTCRQTDYSNDNYYEDIEIRIEKVDFNVKNDTEKDNAFQSFGYNRGKSPVRFGPIRDVNNVSQETKRQDSLKDNPITLIL